MLAYHRFLTDLGEMALDGAEQRRALEALIGPHREPSWGLGVGAAVVLIGILLIVLNMVGMKIAAERHAAVISAPARVVRQGPAFTELPRISREDGYGWEGRKIYQFSSADAGELFQIYIAMGGTKLCVRTSKNGGPWIPFYFDGEFPGFRLVDAKGNDQPVINMSASRLLFRVIDPSVRLAYYWMEEDRRPGRGKTICNPEYKRFS